MFRKLMLAVFAGSLLFAVAASAAVNINTADKSELVELKGVGPVLAERIVEDRKANGDYTSLDQLARVKGIGSETVDDLRGEATLGK